MTETIRNHMPARPAGAAWLYWTLLGLALWVSFLPASGLAALPGLAKSQAAAPDSPAAPSLEERTAAVRDRLDQVRARLLALPPDEAAVPPGASGDEWAEFTRLLNLLGSIYEHHLDALSKLKDVRQSRQDLQDKAAAWQGFQEPGPFPVDFVDDLWKQVRVKDREIAAARLEQTVLREILESRRLGLRNSGRTLREAEEQLERAGSADEGRARWAKDLSELRSRYDEARVAALDTELELLAETLAGRLDERDLMQRKAMAASRVSPLSAKDRDAKLAALVHALRDLQAETLRASGDDRAAQDRLQEARKELLAAGAKAQEQDLGRLKQELDAREAEAEASGAALKVLRFFPQFLAIQQQVWEQRYQIEHAGDPETLADILAKIRQSLERVAGWREYLRSDLDTARRRVDAQQTRLGDWNPEYGERALAERQLLAYQQLETVLRRAMSETDNLDASLRSLEETVHLRQAGATFTERLRELSVVARELAAQVWDFELLTVEDKIVAEGREIVGKRSVTVSKIVQVFLILGVGLWLTARIADYGRRLMTRRLPGRESGALLGLRLFTLLAVVGLVLFALITVNIPLTVFTFMGGALAIGVGFGAQNILNNFISGLILLAERPIKLGDIVDVDGVRGRVTHIGSRCCQVHRFDGIDMLIPNSSFLEKNVTNWTLSDQHLRCTITVGVDYAAPVGEAMALVGRAADEHPQALKDPVPEVYLEEFGDNALILRLDFWVDLVVEPNWRRVMSGIRQRIRELFQENGIPIAFPQRDVHLDSVKPVKVELVAGVNFRQG